MLAVFEFLVNLWEVLVVFPWSTGGLGKAVAIMMALLFALVALLIGMVLFGILQWLYNKFVWATQAKPCAHCSDKTLRMSDGAFPGCRNTNSHCCADCHHQHEMDNEESRRCFKDGAVMEKVSIDGTFISDRCPDCGGIWLDDVNELNAIKQLGYNEGYQDGRSSGSSGGMATGIAIGIAAG